MLKMRIVASAVLTAGLISISTHLPASASAGGFCVDNHCVGAVEIPSASGAGGGSGGGAIGGGGGADYNPIVYSGPGLPSWLPSDYGLVPGGVGLNLDQFTLGVNPLTGFPMITLTPPPGTPPKTPPKTVTISPAQVAQAAYSQITLPKPTIGSAPCTRADCKGAVGLPVWLWTDPGNWTPRAASASLGAVTVNVTARLASVTWSMGDGGSVTCTKPGAKYNTSMGFRSSPDCGYKYLKTSLKQPGGRYTIQAVATYNVVFSGAYQATLNPTTSSSVSVAVTEYQALVER